MEETKFKLALLPPVTEVETANVLKKMASAHRYLAELKGMAATIPNENILISTLVLQEAKDSSAIENIITTHDDLYKAQLFGEFYKNAAAKEVSRYSDAMKHGFRLTREQKILSHAHILEIQRILEQNDAGYRKLPGTKLLNEATGKIVYTPPQDYDTILMLMQNLVNYINDDNLSGVDPLVKMAIIHYQFESIHPFYDGNGRTGRIINILYLVLKDLLHLPILYLSRYIIRNKSSYYRLLQEVRVNNNWEGWILYILDGIEQMSKETIITITKMKELMQRYKHTIRKELPKIYSQDLLNNLFRHPYTKIDFLKDELQVSRLTASKYLEQLVKFELLEKQKIWKTNYYINLSLFHLFRQDEIEKETSIPITTINPDYEKK